MQDPTVHQLVPVTLSREDWNTICCILRDNAELLPEFAVNSNKLCDAVEGQVSKYPSGTITT